MVVVVDGRVCGRQRTAGHVDWCYQGLADLGVINIPVSRLSSETRTASATEWMELVCSLQGADRVATARPWRPCQGTRVL